MGKMDNQKFLNSVFGKSSENVHVTDFQYDPNHIPAEKMLSAWMGDIFSKYKFKSDTSNQYFTVSTFKLDEKGKARRRKSLFIATHVIVLDDVKEKLSMAAVNLMPRPSYILETSPGSEQWGYILDKPCTDRAKVENLLDGLVANGLAPDGKDPGMKGVTRYVRLPDGCNTKKSKMVNGVAFKCRLLKWSPFITATIEELAAPFVVNLTKPRRETQIDGAANVPDHPLLQCGLVIKDIRSHGRFDITCPWVDEHTDDIDDGAAIFTNLDGSMGFKCHHGNCETRTGKHLLDYLENIKPGFKTLYKSWQFKHVLNDNQPFLKPPVKVDDTINDVLIKILKEPSTSKESRMRVSEFLKMIDDISEIDKHYFHLEICEYMDWSKGDFTKIIKSLRCKWYQKEKKEFYDSIVFVKEQNRFYDYDSKIFFTPDAFQNSFSHEDAEAKKEALMYGKVEKVDKMDFCPKMPRIFTKDKIIFANTWNAARERTGIPGDCANWLNHFDYLGWKENKKHMLQFMAYTILYPENKINHMLLLGGMEGTGKDFLLYPLVKAMGDYSTVIDGHELLSGFNEYLLGTKHLHINETELGDHVQALEVSTKIKPLAAAPPDTLRVNQKGISPIKVQNIINLTMTTNSQVPVKLKGPSRRFYAVWSDLTVRDSVDEMLPEWVTYWNIKWNWMKNGGVDNCIHYLRNYVDLSDFNPGTAPKMTEFLRNIREDSKSPGQQTIEAFIKNKVGSFNNDLITSSEAVATLKSGFTAAESFTYIDNSWFTPTRVGKIMSSIPSCIRLRARGDTEIRLWTVRNKKKYQSMGLVELYKTYKDQNIKGDLVQ